MKFVKTYLGGVKTELKKVTWLSKDAMIGSTAVVWIFAIVTALFLYLVDNVVGTLVWSLFDWVSSIK